MKSFIGLGTVCSILNFGFKTFTLLKEDGNRLVGEGAAARGPGKPGEYTKQVTEKENTLILVFSLFFNG